MILVVADTSPLRYLVEINLEYLLPKLFDTIWVPGAVVEELRHNKTPSIVRQWARQLPDWIVVQDLESTHPVLMDLAGLDRGEREAIGLAKLLNANLLLIDDRAGARMARMNGFRATGTLGVLEGAARSGFISIDDALASLAATNFRRTPELFEQVRKRALETKRPANT
jgi:predicted nucleic acid-binding protein